MPLVQLLISMRIINMTSFYETVSRTGPATLMPCPITVSKGSPGKAKQTFSGGVARLAVNPQRKRKKKLGKKKSSRNLL